MGKSEKVGKMRFYPMPAGWLDFTRSDDTWETNFATELLDPDARSAPRLHLAGHRTGRRHFAVAPEPGPHTVSAPRDTRVPSIAWRRVNGAPACAARRRRVADDAGVSAPDGHARVAWAGRGAERG